MAKEDLIISKWKIDAYLLENGDMQIVEDITFNFNKKFNGVFREIVLDRTSGVSGIRVQEITATNPKEYDHVENAKNGDSDVFLIEEESNRVSIQIFSPSKDEKKTFRIGYAIKDVAVKYNDIGELYYKFLGKENETPIERFTVNIKLPQTITDNQIKIFAHGPQNGRIGKGKNNTYFLNVEDVPSNTFIEGRILFPKDLIPLSNNVQSIERYSKILEEEASYQNKKIEDRERKQKIKRTLAPISLWTSVFGFVVFLICLMLFKREKDIYQREEYIRIPEDCTPAVASYLTGAMIGTNTIFATILDLFRKGNVTIKEENGGEDFTISQLKQEDYYLLKHEKYFMDWLFRKMGNGHSVSTKEIKDFTEYNSSKFVTMYSLWKDRIKKDVVFKGYYDKSKIKYGVLLLIYSIIVFILGIFTLIYESLFGLIGLASSILLFIYSMTLFYRFSDYGYKQYKKWMDFRKFIKKYNRNLSKDDLMNSSLDISLIYALGLGIEKKIDGLHFDKADYSTEIYSHNNWIFWYFLFVNNENNAFHKTMDQSFGGTTGSYSGGGFTGGGGGGAGGGGAGGF